MAKVDESLYRVTQKFVSFYNIRVLFLFTNIGKFVVTFISILFDRLQNI